MACILTTNPDSADVRTNVTTQLNSNITHLGPQLSHRLHARHRGPQPHNGCRALQLPLGAHSQQPTQRIRHALGQETGTAPRRAGLR
jgi:hypothetical protein